jgi:hypothetical protein
VIIGCAVGTPFEPRNPEVLLDLKSARRLARLGALSFFRSTPPVEQTKDRHSRDEHQPALRLRHCIRLRIQQVCSHQKNFFAIVETVLVGIRV